MSLKKNQVLLPLISIVLYIVFIRINVIIYNPFNYINGYRLLLYAFAKDITYDYLNIIHTNRENIKLKKELSYYKTFRHSLLYCQNEARQTFYINKTLSFLYNSELSKIYISKIIGYDMSGKKATIEIYRDHHIKEGDIVSDNGYFIGLVYKTVGDVAYVMTVYNNKFNTIVYDYRTGDSYIYKGGYPYGKLINVGANDDIKIGDLLYFRSLKSMNLPYLLVGKVIDIQKTKNLFFLNVDVGPGANPNIYDFAVVIERKNE